MGEFFAIRIDAVEETKKHTKNYERVFEVSMNFKQKCIIELLGNPCLTDLIGSIDDTEKMQDVAKTTKVEKETWEEYHHRVSRVFIARRINSIIDEILVRSK